MPTLTETTRKPKPDQTQIKRLVGVLEAASQETTDTQAVRLHLSVGEQSPVEIPLSPATLRTITRLLEEVAEGRALPAARRRTRTELTTQEAADHLGVSRTYLVKLLDEGRIPCRRVGHYRRIRREDLERFKQEDQAKRREGMAELAAYTQEIGLDY